MNTCGDYEVTAGGRNGKLMKHETTDRAEAVRTAKLWAKDHHSARVIRWDGSKWSSVDWWQE